ncbi:hypothetical protein [Sanguibacter sp. HDW7]|uniref:hypothetical protein n=1 Tax=Sanguibacter sp. HDW7 TaxID=2714931 RepID=UPI00140B2FC7|nr:hypothetical protein [Sanguibacter sp. HDW7]QIK83093.1 hypothetical protein G7063_05225 [Sanguibacter sp. HDW7]
MADDLPRHGGTRHPVADPTGDHRADYLARLEYDLNPDAGRRAIAYTDRTPAPGVALATSRGYRRARTESTR